MGFGLKDITFAVFYLNIPKRKFPKVRFSDLEGWKNPICDFETFTFRDVGYVNRCIFAERFGVGEKYILSQRNLVKSSLSNLLVETETRVVIWNFASWVVINCGTEKMK